MYYIQISFTFKLFSTYCFNDCEVIIYLKQVPTQRFLILDAPKDKDRLKSKYNPIIGFLSGGFIIIWHKRSPNNI